MTALRKATDEQLRAACRTGLTITETALRYGMSTPSVHGRAKRLGLVFLKRPGLLSTPQKDKCGTCLERKLCLMCHKLRVSALPCEADLPLHGRSESQGAEVWQDWYEKLANRKT